MSKHSSESHTLPLRPRLTAALRAIGVPEDRRRELADRVVLDEWIIETILIEIMQRVARLERARAKLDAEQP